MEVINRQDQNKISGGDCIATLVFSMPTSSTRSFNNIMIAMSANTITNADGLIQWIEGLQNVQGMSFEGIKLETVTYQNFKF